MQHLAVADTMVSRSHACLDAASASATMLRWSTCKSLPAHRSFAARMQDFAAAWANLVTDVLAAAPEAQGRLLFDIMNEPDGRAPGRNSHMYSQHATRQRTVKGGS